jgi:hypothetical protein
MEAGAEDAKLDEFGRTTMVSTIPMSRAASLRTGPAPLLREEKKLLFVAKLATEMAGFR